MKSQLAAAAAQVRANARLQVLLAAVLACVVFVLWDTIGRARDDVLEEVADEQGRLQRMAALSEQAYWPERAAEAERIRDALMATIPSVASPGLAQAAVQSWLREITQAYGSDVRISTEPPADVDDMEGIVRISATLSGGIDARRALQIIGRIEGSTDFVVVRAVQIRSDRNPNATITLSALYRVRGPEGTTAP